MNITTNIPSEGQRSTTRRFLKWFFSAHVLGRCLLAVACLFTLIALFYAEENWRGKRAWGNFKREWEAKGERFDLASVVPPPVPDDQNFFMTPLFAPLCDYVTMGAKGTSFSQNYDKANERLGFDLYGGLSPSHDLPSFGSWQTQRSMDLKAWQVLFRKKSDFPAATAAQNAAADVLLVLRKFEPELVELKSASQRPYARFPVQYQEDVGALLPHLHTLRQAARALLLRSVAELELSNSEQALEDIQTGFRLADTVKTEPLLISQLVRIATIEIMIQGVWEGLSKQRWKADQLVMLQNQLKKIDILAAYQLVMRGERSVFFNQFAEKQIMAGLSPKKVAEIISIMGGDEIMFVSLLLNPHGWVYHDMIFANRYYQEWLAAVNVSEQRVNCQAMAQAENKLRRALTDRSRYTPASINSNSPIAHILARRPWHTLSALMLPAMQESLQPFALAQTSINQAQIACALERYRLAHGQFPDTLDALVPQFIEKLPHDIINGQPLKYRRTEDGQFILYSVGWNETDDGGVVAMAGDKKHLNQDIEKGDWVWRYPTK